MEWKTFLFAIDRGIFIFIFIFFLFWSFPFDSSINLSNGKHGAWQYNSPAITKWMNIFRRRRNGITTRSDHSLCVSSRCHLFSRIDEYISSFFIFLRLVNAAIHSFLFYVKCSSMGYFSFYTFWIIPLECYKIYNKSTSHLSQPCRFNFVHFHQHQPVWN